MNDERCLFREWRKRLGLTQLQASERLGLGYSKVRDYDQGRQKVRKPYIYAMVAIERGLTADDLGKVNSD